MSFLNPTYLWALLGLAIPIAIHLWSKKEGKTIKIGSIKLLDEAESNQSSSINLNELLLLFIRLVLLTILVFILAEPKIEQNIPKEPITFIVEPSLINHNAVQSFLDSIDSDASIRILQSGFPKFDAEDPVLNVQTIPNYWQLTNEMETLHTDSIVVLTNALLSGFRGKRPQIKKNIEWITFDVGTPTNTLLKAIRNEDQLQLVSLQSNAQRLSFESRIIQDNNQNIEYNSSNDSLRLLSFEDQKWTFINSQEKLKILLFHEDAFINENTYLEAAFNAISKHVHRPIEIEKVKELNDLDLDKYDVIVWLSDSQAPEINAKILQYKKDEFSRSLIEPSIRRNRYYLTQPLNSENIIDDHLAEQLLTVLELNKELDKKINNYDQRIMARDELLPKVKEVQAESIQSLAFSISKWLWIIFAIVLILERLISDLRRQ